MPATLAVSRHTPVEMLRPTAEPEAAAFSAVVYKNKVDLWCGLAERTTYWRDILQSPSESLALPASMFRRPQFDTEPDDDDDIEYVTFRSFRESDD